MTVAIVNMEKDRFLAAVEAFRGSITDTSVIGTRLLVNPLLDLWELAQAIHPEVAAPIERILTGFVAREMTNIEEIDDLVRTVQALAECKHGE